MTMKRRIAVRWRKKGTVIFLSAWLSAATAMCRAQQPKGNPGLQNAAAQLQQQQMSVEQAKAFGQASSPNPTMRQPNGSVSSVPQGDDPLFTLGDSVRTKRNDERQKRLESDTQRLLNLANQLKSEVAASGAESMTPEMLRQMDEIEKLAKSVKERMRN